MTCFGCGNPHFSEIGGCSYCGRPALKKTNPDSFKNTGIEIKVSGSLVDTGGLRNSITIGRSGYSLFHEFGTRQSRVEKKKFFI